MKQLITRLSAPFATFAVMLMSALPVAAANDCNDPTYNLLPVKLNLISLPAQFCGEGGFNPSILTLIITGLNAIAVGIVLLLGARLVVIGISALSALNKKDATVDEKSNETLIIQQTVLSIAQALIVAVFGYLIVTQGANLLLSFGNAMLNGYEKDPACVGVNSPECFNWLDYTGPFAGLAARAQALLSLVVIAFGTFLLGKTWIGYLQKTGFDTATYESGKGMKMDLLKSAIMRTVAVAVVTVLAFFAIAGGPNLFAKSIIDIGGSVIDPGSDCVDGNC
jgi:hypothetical protein